MKESLFLALLAVIITAVCAEETILLIDVIKHGATAPKYTENPLYKVTDTQYKEDPGELTDEGTIQMKRKGQDLKQKFIQDNKFLPDKYSPEFFFHKTYNEEPSVMSAYAMMLGAYPDSIGWIQYANIDTDHMTPPFSRLEELEARSALDLTNSPDRSTSKDITIWAEGEGPSLNCGQLNRDFEASYDSVSIKYDDNHKFDGLYEDISETLNVPPEKLSFKTAHLFLDDYISAKANGRKVPLFTEEAATNQMIKNYYKTYLYEGKFGQDSSTARIVANNFFNYVITSMYGKEQVDRENIENDNYHHLKYAQFVGNEYLMASINKMLGLPVENAPEFGSGLRFELFENQGEYYVRSTNDDRPIPIGGSKNGVMKSSDFMNYIYEKLYFGNIYSYCAGQEDISQHTYPTFNSYEEYLKSRNVEFRNIKASTAQSSAQKTSTQQSSAYSTSTTSSERGSKVQGNIEVRKSEDSTSRTIEIAERTPAIVNTAAYVPERFVMQNRPEPIFVQPRAEQFTIERQVPSYSSSFSAGYHQTKPISYANGQYYDAGSKAAPVVEVQTQKWTTCSEKPAHKCWNKGKYDPRNTHECTVDIPYLHAVDLPQVIHDRQVVVVPKKEVVVEEKVRVQEKIVPEKPTEIHYIKLDSQVTAPTMFAEHVTEKVGWPWWWWIPLLVAWCWLPLWWALLWYCWRSKPEAPKPIAKPKAPVQAAAPQRRVVEENVVEPRKSYAIKKREVDQEAEINAEIQREIDRSNVRRAVNLRQKEERKVIEHHPRYLETNKSVEEEFKLAPYDRVSTYDMVSRSQRGYQDIDDSHIVKQRDTKVANIIDRTYNPGVLEIDTRESRAQMQEKRSTVNQANRADNYEDDSYLRPSQNPISNRTGNIRTEVSPRNITNTRSGARIEGDIRPDTRQPPSPNFQNNQIVSQRNAPGTSSGEDLRKESYSSNQKLKAAISGQQNVVGARGKGAGLDYDSEEEEDSEY